MKQVHRHNSPIVESKDSSLKVAFVLTVLGLCILLANSSAFNHKQGDGIAQLEQASSEQKQVFIEVVRRHVTKVNRKIKYQQALLDKLNQRLAGQSFHSNNDLRKLRRLYLEYGINVKIAANNYDSNLVQLQQRMQTVDASIIIAMAALESNWGRSKRALSYNNYFIKSCIKLSCDPPQYSDYFDSVKSLVQLVNTHNKFEVFRNTRAGFQRRGKIYTGAEIIGTLKYASIYTEKEFQALQQLLLDNSL